MPKQLIFSDDARRKILDGVNKLADVVAVMMGPKLVNEVASKTSNIAGDGTPPAPYCFSR